MREPHRLRTLQVRVARHQRVDMGARLDEQRAAQLVDQIDQLLGRADRIQPQIGRDLIIATACGVEPAAGIADLIDQARLDVHVDVLERVVPGQRTARELLLDAA